MITCGELKTLINEDFKYLTSISIEEQLLYKKWCEIHERSYTDKELQKIYEVKKSIWTPKKPDDYLDLKPTVVWMSDKNQQQVWHILRIFLSSMPWKQTPGRCLKFAIIDKPTQTYLGVISIASDLLTVGNRNEFIGWKTNKDTLKMIGHTAIGSTIVPTQPLGFNYTGGKLMSLLVGSDIIEKTWDMKYGQKLVGFTTTSLYGGFSQYSNLKYWKKLNTTEGKFQMHPSDAVYDQLREYVKEKYPEEYQKTVKNENGKVATNPKMRVINLAKKHLKFKIPETNAPRGVYFCPLYTNTYSFLRRETNDIGSRLFDGSTDSISDMWKEKYAKKRIKNVLDNDKYNTDIHFYDDLIKLSWEETKEKYLKDVGR